jgi:Cu-Zn family superoxide dismutase
MKQLVLLATAAIVLAGCASTSGPVATASMQATSGSSVSGTVRLQQMADSSVRVTLDLNGVPPGVHGFHIHEKGDCGDNGNAAGSHFNPTASPHGAPEAASKHAGDWGNVTADASGRVQTEFTTRSITLTEGAISAAGRALILHANPDDLTTQPTGNAGGRIACGVVSLQQMAGAMQQ